MEILQIIFAGGLGAVIGTVIQSVWASKTAKEQRTYQEKKEAYVGFLNAIYRSGIEKTHEAALYAGHCKFICEIVGNQSVRDCLKRYEESNPIDGKAHPERHEVMEDLKEAMRQELGFSVD